MFAAATGSEEKIGCASHQATNLSRPSRSTCSARAASDVLLVDRSDGSSMPAVVLTSTRPVTARGLASAI